jgi:hypothetical protein
MDLEMTKRRLSVVLLVAIFVAAGTATAAVARTLTAPGNGATKAPSATPHSAVTPKRQATTAPPVYLHYYLWWTPQHWKSKLGPDYPYGASQPPLPGKLDADACNPQVSYAKAQVVDLPAEGLYDQGDQSTFTRHITLAWQAGIQGFLVSWQGTGNQSQGPGSSGYNSRLELLVGAVNTFNAAHGSNFGLGLAFAAYGNYNRPANEVIGDLTYFQARYGNDRAFRSLFDSKPMVMWLDSRKFSADTVAAVSASVRAHVYLLGDETAQTWARDADFLDGTSYYWSTENPWSNPQAGSTISKLADAVRARGKRWFAPFIPGYNKQLLGGSCVPRHGTETLAKVWEANAASHPDGWFGISWNELVENTHLEPSATYGTRYLDALSTLIRNQR